MFQRLGLEHLEYHSSVAKELQKLLKIPLDSYNNMLVILKLKHYAGKVKKSCEYRHIRTTVGYLSSFFTALQKTLKNFSNFFILNVPFAK